MTIMPNPGDRISFRPDGVHHDAGAGFPAPTPCDRQASRFSGRAPSRGWPASSSPAPSGHRSGGTTPGSRPRAAAPRSGMPQWCGCPWRGHEWCAPVPSGPASPAPAPGDRYRAHGAMRSRLSQRRRPGRAGCRRRSSPPSDDASRSHRATSAEHATSCRALPGEISTRSRRRSGRGA